MAVLEDNPNNTNQEITLGERLRPHWLKRFMAPLFDIVVIFFVSFALYSILLLTPASSVINSYRYQMQDIQDSYKLETGYGEKKTVTAGEEGDHRLHYDEETSTYYIVTNVTFSSESEKAEITNQYKTALSSDETYQSASFYYHLHNYVLSAVVSVGIVEAICLFLVPLLSKGATLGMLLFKTRLISDKYWGTPKWYQYLGRMAFIWLIESCIPYIWLVELTAILVPIVLLIVSLTNKKRKSLHDWVSGVMIADKTSLKQNGILVD